MKNGENRPNALAASTGHGACMEMRLDEALAASFPASDPVHLGAPLAAIFGGADMIALRANRKDGF